MLTVSDWISPLNWNQSSEDSSRSWGESSSAIWVGFVYQFPRHDFWCTQSLSPWASRVPMLVAGLSWARGAPGLGLPAVWDCPYATGLPGLHFISTCPQKYPTAVWLWSFLSHLFLSPVVRRVPHSAIRFTFLIVSLTCQSHLFSIPGDPFKSLWPSSYVSFPFSAHTEWGCFGWQSPSIRVRASWPQQSCRIRTCNFHKTVPSRCSNMQEHVPPTFLLHESPTVKELVLELSNSQCQGSCLPVCFSLVPSIRNMRNMVHFASVLKRLFPCILASCSLF